MSARHAFVIDRSRWARGKRDMGNLLLGDDGAMCCLGFYLESCGVNRSDLLRVGDPDVVASSVSLPEETRWLVREENDDGEALWFQSPECRLLIDENDERVSHLREERIAAMFAKQGIDVTFVDGEP